LVETLQDAKGAIVPFLSKVYTFMEKIDQVLTEVALQDELSNTEEYFEQRR
jgi:hypothetical protein